MATVYTQVGLRLMDEGVDGVRILMNPILIRAEPITGTAFGAARLVKRGLRYMRPSEEWAMVPDDYNHLRLRVYRDRRINGSPGSLYQCLGQRPCAGAYALEVTADGCIGRRAREAWMAVRFTPVTIRRPQRLDGSEYPLGVKLYAVDAREINSPAGQEPIHWLSHHPWCDDLGASPASDSVVSLALLMELLFAALKTAGLNIEASEQGSGCGQGVKHFQPQHLLTVKTVKQYKNQ